MKTINNLFLYVNTAKIVLFPYSFSNDFSQPTKLQFWLLTWLLNRISHLQDHQQFPTNWRPSWTLTGTCAKYRTRTYCYLMPCICISIIISIPNFRLHFWTTLYKILYERICSNNSWLFITIFYIYIWARTLRKIRTHFFHTS